MACGVVRMRQRRNDWKNEKKERNGIRHEAVPSVRIPLPARPRRLLCLLLFFFPLLVLFSCRLPYAPLVIVCVQVYGSVSCVSARVCPVSLRRLFRLDHLFFFFGIAAVTMGCWQAPGCHSFGRKRSRSVGGSRATCTECAHLSAHTRTREHTDPPTHTQSGTACYD